MADDTPRPMVRLRAFDGMKVDAGVWNDAHDFHVRQQRHHGLDLHGAGIVHGLEVVAVGDAARTVVITPGVALDAQGAMIVVSHAQQYAFTSTRKGTLYLVLQLREIPDRTLGDGADDAMRHARLEQAYRIQESETIPGRDDIELARVMVDDPKAPIVDAADPLNPSPHEIDRRFRLLAGTHCRGRIEIGRLIAGDEHRAHADGLFRLIDSINAATPYRARFRGDFLPGEDAAECAMLYFAGRTGFEISDRLKETLEGFLRRGGVLWGDGCRQGGKDQFGLSFDQLAGALGRKPSQLAPPHPAMGSHFVFGAPPPGALDGGVVLAAEGILYSGCDYGCLWAGRRKDGAASREEIRSALEWGVNVAVLAHHTHSRICALRAVEAAP